VRNVVAPKHCWIRSQSPGTFTTMDEIGQLLERERITKVMNRYCTAVDTKDVDGFVAVFTNDGVANYTRDDLVGHDALRAFFDQFVGQVMEATHHQISNIDIDFVDDDHARATSYITAWHRFNEPRPDYVVHGRYLDKWHQIAGEWQLAERRIDMMGDVVQPR